MSHDLHRNAAISYANAVLRNTSTMSNRSPNEETHTSSPSNPHNTNTNSSYPQSIENNSHPLYLHNNDQPGMVLISKKLTYMSFERDIHEGWS